jgi:HD-GYP domain-containing protein (c-di-GMP phosphodiesterase class II)
VEKIMDLHTLQSMPVEFRQFREALSALAKLVYERRLFPPAHIAVENAISEAFIRLDVMLQEKDSVTFKIRGSFISYLNYKVNIGDRSNKEINFLREKLLRLHVDEVEFCSGLTKKELSLLGGFLQSAGRGGGTNGEWLEITNIKIRHSIREYGIVDKGETVNSNAESGKTEKESDQVELSRESQSKMGKIISGVLLHMSKIGQKEGRDSGGRLLKLVEREGHNSSSIMLLGSLRDFDDYTFSHSVNVAVISTAIGRWMGLSEEAVDDLGIAALMHDMGKIYVPRQILHKKGRLTPEEWLEVKKHPIYGYRILREENVDHTACRVAYEHHMRYDLKGYPVPKSKIDLHNYSHIVRIADSYDALTTNRPYRKQLNPFNAVKLMSGGRGNEFHPQFLDVFLNVLGNIPVGTMLKLESGEIAVVINVNEKYGKLPIVRILRDGEGNSVDRDIVVDLNQRREETGNPSIIKGILDGFEENVDIGRYLLE